MFIGRKNELDYLNSRFESGRKEFGVIYGRRRIGKSSIIEHFLEGKPNVFFQAKKDSIYGNLRSFSYEIDKLLSLPSKHVFDSFEETFDSIIEFAGGKRFVIAIDEYPYIISQDSSFSSVLQEVIDRAPDNLFFLISGSDVSMLKDEIVNHNSPLYKRRTFEMNIRKMRYDEAILFLDFLDKEERLKYLSITSTYPYYLAAMNYKLSFEENIKSLIFNEYGTFFTLPDQLLSNSTNTQDVYNAILEAIAGGKRTNKEISIHIHEDEAKVSKYISTLLSSELLERRETYMGTKKTVFYEIGDPMLRFWYSFVYENQEKIKKNGEMIFEGLKKDIKRFVSFGFEEISREYMDYLNCEGKLGSVFSDFKPYKVERSILGRSVEIDGLSDDGKTLIVMECKYRESKFTLGMLKHLKESASVFPNKLKRKYYLFSKGGFSEDLLKMRSDDVKLIDFDMLFNLNE